MAALGYEVATDPPAFDSAAGNVARPDDDVVLGVERALELDEVANVVREVGVHLEEALVTIDKALPERIDVRRTQAELAWPMHHANVRVGLGERVGQLPRSVRRIVVDDEKVCTRKSQANGLDEPRKVLRLIVRG